MNAQIQIIDNKVFLCQEITAQNQPINALAVYTSPDFLITALKKRMSDCINALQDAYQQQQILSVNTSDSGTNIQYTNGKGFSSRSYKAMEDAIKIIETFPEEVTAEHLELLSHIQLNQLKKAVVEISQGWTLLASCIEEVEYFVYNRQYK